MNYQKELDRLLEELVITKRKPLLLLHSCCAPCSSYVIEYLSVYFKIVVFYYNPNIYPPEEHGFRSEEQERFIRLFLQKKQEEDGCMPQVEFLGTPYRPEEFYDVARGLASEPEGGRRCEACFHLRLEHAARKAKEIGADYFTTTLSISPLKSAEKLNRIGGELSKQYDIPYLYSDFKKKGGYLRSVELSKEYSMYRQDYCGCVYSKEERLRKQSGG